MFGAFWHAFAGLFDALLDLFLTFDMHLESKFGVLLHGVRRARGRSGADGGFLALLTVPLNSWFRSSFSVGLRVSEENGPKPSRGCECWLIETGTDCTYWKASNTTSKHIRGNIT